MFIDFLDFFIPPLLVYFIYSKLHVSWFCNFCTPSTFIPTSTVIREMRVDNIGSFQDKLVESKYKYFFWTGDSPLTTLVTLQLVVAKWSGAMLTHQMH